ncbi:MAG: DUF433 domain-containing protein [Bacteroidales bacterium]|nr:DUF433 domain-containing protein [Bacteroidales bacterium]
MHKRITIDASVCNGKPTIRDKKVMVETILELLGNGKSMEEIMEQFPGIVEDDIKACFSYAADFMKHQYTKREFVDA